ncbi:MAG TPA: response regulator transcription factor [Thermoanaerobaculia bacterium]|nr:response regulator transcription factor [Thermoanaerobaculia bacterium]
MTIRVVIADDHPIVLDGLEQVFRLEPDLEVTGRCRDGEEALAAVRARAPDVLVLDVRMPRIDGLEVARRLRQEGSSTRVVLLTAALDDPQLLEAMELGVAGVVLKEKAPQLLVEAVRQVHQGGEWLDQGVVGRVLRQALRRESAVREAMRQLTPREMEIVRLVAAGKRNRAIAEVLFITEGTVKIHLHNVYEKLDLRGRLELALYARSKGLV